AKSGDKPVIDCGMARVECYCWGACTRSMTILAGRSPGVAQGRYTPTHGGASARVVARLRDDGAGLPTGRRCSAGRATPRYCPRVVERLLDDAGSPVQA